jgi:hypothetical protein
MTQRDHHIRHTPNIFRARGHAVCFPSNVSLLEGSYRPKAREADQMSLAISKMCYAASVLEAN